MGVAQAPHPFLQELSHPPPPLRKSRRVSVASGARFIPRDHEHAFFFGRHLVKHQECRACSIEIISSPSKRITEKRSRTHSNSGTALQTGGPRLPISGVLGPPESFGTRALKYAFTRHNSGVPCRKLAGRVPKLGVPCPKRLLCKSGFSLYQRCPHSSGPSSRSESAKVNIEILNSQNQAVKIESCFDRKRCSRFSLNSPTPVM